jgi:D-glycero-D-manno-heptose 1,7-bisphosphate phosphatase
LLDEAAYHATRVELDRLLAGGGARLDAQYHCPHHPDLSGMCECRKPGTLLYHRAAADLGLDLGRSWWIGDRLRDIAAAGALGGRGLLVRTGRGAEEARRVEATLWPTTRDLRSAVGLVLSERGVPDYFPRP